MLKKACFCFLFVLFLPLVFGCNRSQIPIEATSTLTKEVASPLNATSKETPITPEPSKMLVSTMRPSNTGIATHDPIHKVTDPPFPTNKVIALNSIDAGGFLIDLANDKPRQLLVNEQETRILAWALGCEGLYVETKAGDVVLVDIGGNVIRKFYSKIHADNMNKLFPVPNPNGNWLAYQIGEGQQTYSGYERENVEVLSIENQAAPVRLSLSGGGWVKAWSPNGSYLAFSDFDQNLVHQVYVWNVKDRRTWQISTFTDSSIRINRISWALDERTLSIANKDASNTASITLLSVDSKKQVYPQVDLVFDLVKDVWWLNEYSFLTHVLPKNAPSTSSENEQLVWINSSGTELGKLLASEIPQGITFSGPFNGETIGVFSNADFFTYDLNAKSLSKRIRVYLNIASWVRTINICR